MKIFLVSRQCNNYKCANFLPLLFLVWVAEGKTDLLLGAFIVGLSLAEDGKTGLLSGAFIVERYPTKTLKNVK